MRFTESSHAEKPAVSREDYILGVSGVSGVSVAKKPYFSGVGAETPSQIAGVSGVSKSECAA